MTVDRVSVDGQPPHQNEHHLNIDCNFDHQMSISKNKCWNSNNCLHFLNPACSIAGCLVKQSNFWASANVKPYKII